MKDKMLHEGPFDMVNFKTIFPLCGNNQRCFQPIQPDGELGYGEFFHQGTHGGGILSSQRQIGL